MIKVIAADMDGTLLNSGHTISEQTYQTIQDVQQGGIRFMIATGRDYPSASDTLKNFPLDCDWVTGSGAEIRNRDGELLQTIPMFSCVFFIYQGSFEKSFGNTKRLSMRPPFVRTQDSMLRSPSVSSMMRAPLPHGTSQ